MKHLFSYDQLTDPKPMVYKISISNKCTLHCSWCNSRNHTDLDFQTDMNEKTFVKALDMAIGDNAGVILTGGGEPTENPRFCHFVDMAVIALKQKNIRSLNLMSNGVHLDKVQYFLNKTKGFDNSWVRLSINDRKMPPEFLDFLKANHKRVVLKIVLKRSAPTAEETLNIQENMKFREFAKDIIVRLETDYTQTIKRIPENCIGRHFEKVIEADGTISYCCQFRNITEYNFNHSLHCPAECKFANVEMKKAWDLDPFS